MEMTDAMRARVEAGKQWLAQVREESAAQLNARLAEYETALNASIHGLSNEQLVFTPGADQWSVRQVGLHLTHSVRAVANIVKVLAAGEDRRGEIVMGLLDDDRQDSATELSARLREAFQQAEDATEVFDREFSREKTAQHPYFGPLDCKEWAVFNLMHISIHIQQIERIKNDSAFPA